MIERTKPVRMEKTIHKMIISNNRNKFLHQIKETWFSAKRLHWTYTCIKCRF